MMLDDAGMLGMSDEKPQHSNLPTNYCAAIGMLLVVAIVSRRARNGISRKYRPGSRLPRVGNGNGGSVESPEDGKGEEDKPIGYPLGRSIDLLRPVSRKRTFNGPVVQFILFPDRAYLPTIVQSRLRHIPEVRTLNDLDLVFVSDHKLNMVLGCRRGSDFRRKGEIGKGRRARLILLVSRASGLIHEGQQVL